MNAPVEALKGVSGSWVKTLNAQTAGWLDITAIAALAAGSDE